MKDYRERTYRKRVSPKDLVSFQVEVKETDLWVSADRDLHEETRDLVFGYRHQLERYIQFHPYFLTTLDPYPEDPFAPPMVREMILMTRPLGVGPMAAVAGAIAQYVGQGLLHQSGEVIVENGGDIYLKASRPVTVSVFAGQSPLSEKIGLKIPVTQMPLGICSSSGTVGHSLSMGIADVICILSPSTIRADAAATSLGNRVKGPSDLEAVAARARDMDGLLGGLIIIGDKMIAWGDVELVGL